MKLQKCIGSSYATIAMLIILSVLMSTSELPILQPNPATGVFDTISSSLNWSGYAVTGLSGSVRDAKGSWIVPAIQGPCTLTSQYSSFWVGIDGVNSGTVEQTGTDSDCQNGVATYYAWYEFYPHPAFLISGLTIRPGDHVSADVSFNGRSFVVSIRDVTRGQSFSTSARVRGAMRSSAEWIAEAPSSSAGVLALADFGTVSYGTDNTGIATTCYATIEGTTGPIALFGSSVQEITMVSRGGLIKAQPSSLSSDGTSFSVAWMSSGP